MTYYKASFGSDLRLVNVIMKYVRGKMKISAPVAIDKQLEKRYGFFGHIPNVRNEQEIC